MTEHATQITRGRQSVSQGEVFSPVDHGAGVAKAGSTDVLKALHADLTTTYRDYLEMAKIKPSMLSPAMLGLIQQFLRHNDITAEVSHNVEMNDLQRRLDDRRKARANDPARKGTVNLNQTQRA